MRRRRVVAATLTAVVGWCGSMSAAAQEATQVRVVDNGYEPATATVDAGGTVTWSWTGSGIHTVTARDGSFGSDERTNGATFTHGFPDAGTYGYYCEIHGDVMSGVVEVRGRPQPQPSPSTSAGRPSPTPRPSPPSPTPAPPSPAPLPSPAATSAAPSPSPSAATTAPVVSPAPSAAASSAPVAPSPGRSAATLVTLDEPTPKDRSAVAIALGLAVAALGFGTAGALLFRRPASPPAGPAR